MAISRKKRVLINDFLRLYADRSYKAIENGIFLSKANTDEHNDMVCKVCQWLLKNDIPFYTEFKMKNGLRPDIVCPTYIKPIIEVMHTETRDDFMKNKWPRYPAELKDAILFVQAKEGISFNPIMIQ